MNDNIQIDNRTLVEECLAGDKEALNFFYIRFAPRMLSLIHRYVADNKDAEDILHDGFIVAFTRLNTLIDFERVDYWLASIMRNLSLQFLRNQDLTVMIEEIPDREDTPELEGFIDLEVLESLINKLPPGYQNVFRLAVLENKSHKEIAKLLGIAPNSSSSQLFHAKLMMRRLINEYRLQSGLMSLLLAGSVFLYFLWRNDNSLSELQESLTEASLQTDNVKPDNKNKSLVENSRSAGTITGPKHTSVIIPYDTKVLSENIIASDSVGPRENDQVVETIQQVSKPDSIEEQPLQEDLYAYQPLSTIKAESKKMTFGINVNPVFINFTSGDEFYAYDMAPGDTPATPPEASDFNSYSYEEHHNDLPLSAAITFCKPLSGRIGLETAVSYTYLHTKFGNGDATSDAYWHYIGISERFNLRIHETSRFRFYTNVGVGLDIPAYSNAVSNNRILFKNGKFSSSVVWNISGSLGASVRLSNRIDLFVEPTFQYHFKHSYTVPNTWTDNSFGFTLPIGIRMNW